MKLKKIKIKGLWGKYNLEWKLNSSLNILSGINGSGKSTMLDIIAAILIQGKMTEGIENKTEQVIISLDDGSDIISLSFKDSLLKLRQKAHEDEIYNELWEDVTKDLSTKHRLSEINQIGINASISYMQKKGKRVPLKPYLEKLNINIISTFDTSLPSHTELSRIDQLSAAGVRTELDLNLYILLEKYAYYLGDLANQVEHKIQSNKYTQYRDIQHLYEPKQRFFDIIDDLFKDTKKHIDRESAKLEFLMIDDNRRLSVYDLSSGEKQLLYIYLTILMEQEKEYIVFMDEPEISLHIDWQAVLLENIFKLNPNCQIIMATHAPYILIHGWKIKVTNIEDIKKLS